MSDIKRSPVEAAALAMTGPFGVAELMRAVRGGASYDLCQKTIVGMVADGRLVCLGTVSSRGPGRPRNLYEVAKLPVQV